MDVKLSTLVSADLPPGIDSILLFVEVATAAACTTFFDIPTAVGIGHYVM
tara:strand:+ start:3749 stop:3898 length:150 start_codon:yes stop_codon:yes gene_type:complete